MPDTAHAVQSAANAERPDLLPAPTTPSVPTPSPAPAPKPGGPAGNTGSQVGGAAAPAPVSIAADMGGGGNTGVIIAATVASVATAALALCIVCAAFWWRRRRRLEPKQPEASHTVAHMSASGSQIARKRLQSQSYTVADGAAAPQHGAASEAVARYGAVSIMSIALPCNVSHFELSQPVLV